MMMTYKIPPNLSGDVPKQVIKFLDDGLFVTINLDVESSLRDEYQAWLAEGNIPEPAPEPAPAPVLTPEQKLNAAGLTVAELKELFGLA